MKGWPEGEREIYEYIRFFTMSAAEFLGVHPATLSSRMWAMGI